MFNCDNCIDKCKGACCGVVPMPKDTYEKNKSLIDHKCKVIEFDKDMVVVFDEISFRCGFLSDANKCKIYDERPEVCKKFGNEESPLLCCPYQDKCGRIRSRQEKRYIERKNDKLINLSNI